MISSIITPRSENSTFAQASIYDDVDNNPRGVNVSTRESNGARQVAYGYSRLSGQITFLTADEGEVGEFVHVFVTFTTHKILRFEKLYLDGNEVTFDLDLTNSQWANGDYTYLVFFSPQFGDVNQAANSHLVSQSAILFPDKWTTAHRQRGCAGIYLILKYDSNIFKNGFPEISVTGFWHNQIYDPRDATYKWTNNAALITADYLTNSLYGVGMSQDLLDEDTLKEAADICDELVELSGGGATETRYTINGSFLIMSSYAHQAVLQDFCAAMAGRISWTGAKILIQPGAWITPSILLSESDLRSSPSISIKPTKSSIYNRVDGQHYSLINKWQKTDYPSVRNTSYQTIDGEELIYQLDLPYTTSHYAAQRIAKIALEEARQWIELRALFSMRAYPVEAGDIVSLSIDRLGWNEKEFLVIEKIDRLTMEGACEIELYLKETAEGIYDWNYGEQTEVDLAPNTQLPDPRNLPAPKNLTLESGTDVLDVRSDGTIFSRIQVRWDSTNSPYIITSGRYEIQYKKSSTSTWLDGGSIDGSQTLAYLLDVKDNTYYDIRVRAVTLFRGPWTTITGYLVIGKTEPPTVPTNLNAVAQTSGILLTWNAISDLDLSYYEIRQGESWAAGSVIFVGKVTHYLWEPQSSGSYSFYLKAVDTSRNYSTNSAYKSLEVISPGQVQGLNAYAIYNMVRIDWNEPTSGTFPIAGFNIYKGETFGSSISLGSVSATLKTLLESVGGYYTYWVTAVDVYGNEGEPSGIPLNVDAPPLFILYADELLDTNEADTLDYITIDDNRMYCCVDTTVSYQDHFDDNSWTTLQDQIDAGYPIYAQPTHTVDDAIYEQSYDYGEVLAGALLTFSYTFTWVDGDGLITIRLGYSADNATWYDTDDVTQLWCSNFRYVRVKLTITPDDDTSLCVVSYPRFYINVKSEHDSGVTICSSSDGSGTLVVFNKTFLDIFEDSFQPTFKGSSAYFPSFSVVGNNIYLFLWDTSGNRVSGSVSWALDGVAAT